MMTRQSQHISTNVRAARKKIPGLTQEILAQEAKVSVRTISRLEQGKTEYPRADEFERIAAALNTTVDALRSVSTVRPESPLPTQPVGDEDDTSVVRRNLEIRYGEDGKFVQAVLDKLASEPRDRRLEILGLLLGGIGDALGRPPLVRDPQLTR